MAYIVINADVLESVCDWAITEGDEGQDLTVTWTHEGAVLVSRIASNGDRVEMSYYRVDRDIFFTENLPALKLSNEIEEEDYTV